jgi:hypothetical protein
MWRVASVMRRIAASGSATITSSAVFVCFGRIELLWLLIASPYTAKTKDQKPLSDNPRDISICHR